MIWFSILIEILVKSLPLITIIVIAGMYINWVLNRFESFWVQVLMIIVPVILIMSTFTTLNEYGKLCGVQPCKEHAK